MRTRPPAIAPGGTLAVLAPSSGYDANLTPRLHAGIDRLGRLFGCAVTLLGNTAGDSSGCVLPESERVAALLEAILDDSVTGIFTTWGGLNSSDLLTPLSQAGPLPQKVMVGFSDSTALLLGYQALADCVVYHGPAVLTHLGDRSETQAITFQHLVDMTARGVSGPVPFPTESFAEVCDWRVHMPRALVQRHVSAWRTGTARGTSFGGNISTLNYLLGTPFFQPPDPCVLFLEAVGHDSQVAAVRRSLVHLRDCGLFDSVSALVFAAVACADASQEARLEQVALEVTGDWDFPILGGVPFGHIEPSLTIPLGIRVEICSVPGFEQCRFLDPTVELAR